MEDYRIGFIGAGNMSRALIEGLLDSGKIARGQLSAVDPLPAALQALAEIGIRTGTEQIGRAHV